jgi:cell wall-associated NlpC family hydrolase
MSTMLVERSYPYMSKTLITLCFVFVCAVSAVVFFVNKPHKRTTIAPTISRSDSDTIIQADGRTLKSDRLADSVISYAKTFIGTPYHYTGKCKATGFDCSGFTSFVYGHFGFQVSPGSKDQASAGRPIPIKDASKGDLLIFTGTHIKVREPGHVGIVITKKGEPIQFIHSSSSEDGGVKISQVDSTKYALRLLEVRRIIE